MRKYLLATIALLALAPGANATLIASFSQNPSATPTVTATDNGLSTNILIVDASTIISAGNGSILGTSLFSLNATSIDAAVTLATAVIQHYGGTFCFTSGAGCTGTNFLSGTFSDAAFGGLGGPGLNVNVNNPPDVLTMTSDVIPSDQLAAPNTFGLTFANLSPLLHINGNTIGAFTADFSGTASSSAAPVPEPASLALLGMGLFGLTLVAKRKHNG
jgi:hypothetical protein